MKAGKIYLVGLGPGAEAHMTARAREAIADADVVIGYTTYIRLVQPLLSHQQVVKKGMAEELDRCEEAIVFAKQGKKVALISSGDVGIYGMAGPTYEVLFKSGWSPDSGIAVEVVPGCTALSSCASLVGAPLGHDFCSISLSDLLTPWPVIAKRLNAAACSDFVIALYNPKSGRRTEQIVAAQKILLHHRSGKTPVAIVKSAYRPRQSVVMTTLKKMVDEEIGMLSTVLIGNGETFVKEGIMITPRGYADKYVDFTKEIKEGEQAGHSLSMGLTGWHEIVREHLRLHPKQSMQITSERFDVPMGEVLKAVSEAGDRPIPGRTVERIKRKALPGLLITMKQVRIRWVAGAAEGTITLQDATWAVSESEVQLVGPGTSVALPIDSIKGIWLSRSGSGKTLFMTDRFGAVLLRVQVTAQSALRVAGP
ncbi:precorrin-3 methyltransferase [Magnetococcus marinus MC-1]|uniref:Precorrin-3 methyltransferase n=1 Tax=Magnetococcus marinus (strain ATCC BAA-1437 / JCM 17883 / MC-1) TaxID=156889 RepID=A0LCC5_MAGMM|nr:precorrin-3B C(17)-methyltransferase [Magnetococcus marinus]ABK45618.1 precorrin-3 methyltransferase [Magnetococcus marinus MC-1]